MQELVNVLTKDGYATKKVVLKSEAHRLGLWHASVQIWIVNSNKQVLLQQRAGNKDTYPNLWDISVAGHLSAGDTPKQAAIREIAEEIGVNISFNELCFLKKIKRSKTPKADFLDNEFNFLFLVKKNIQVSNLKLQKEEVANVKWVLIDDFEKQLKLNSKLFVPHGDHYYQYIINKLRLI